MTFRFVATVRDGRKSVLGAKGNFLEREREREGEWQPTTSVQTEGADTGAVRQEMGRDNCDDSGNDLSGVDLNTQQQQQKKNLA
jgi:hypothetical protein